MSARAVLTLTGLVTLAASAFADPAYARSSRQRLFGDYWTSYQVPEAIHTDFPVSKVNAYDRARFTQLWAAFRDQYRPVDGLFVKWRWADDWLSRNSYGSAMRPKLYRVEFEVVSGLGSDGIPVGEELRVRRLESQSPEAVGLDRDARARPTAVSSPGSGTRLRLLDRTSPRTPRFSTYVEVDYDAPDDGSSTGRSGMVYHEVAQLPDSAENQASFIKALQAGSQFRVILKKEVVCRPCGGIGRPPGSRQLGSKCEQCAGSGRVSAAEIVTMKW